MPNAHGQVVAEDFKAPPRQLRIIQEEMSDGTLSILADFYNHPLARETLSRLREEHPEDAFTLCDENGLVAE